eukprot:461342-Amphidinium_carterae.1
MGRRAMGRRCPASFAPSFGSCKYKGAPGADRASVPAARRGGKGLQASLWPPGQGGEVPRSSSDLPPGLYPS